MSYLTEYCEEAFDPLLFARVVSAMESRLRAIGVQVEFGLDFEHLEECLEGLEKDKLTEHFRSDLNTYTPQNAFYIKALNGGELVALIAARFDDLGQQTLDVHLTKYWRRCYPGKAGPKVELAKQQPRFMREISGRVAYLGELWVKPEWRGKRIHEYLVPLTTATAMQRWDPHWMYCWIRPVMWGKDYARAYGFSAVHPVGLIWEDCPATIDPDLVMGVNKRTWVLDWMEGYASGSLVGSHSLPVG